MTGDDDRRIEAVVPRDDLGQPEVSDVPVPRMGPPFDPEPVRERTRERLAVASFALLVLTVGVVLGVVATGLRSWPEMEGAVASVLPAVVSVVSSILGFYFGTRGTGGGG